MKKFGKYFKKTLAVLVCTATVLPLSACTSDPVVQQQINTTEITFAWWGNDGRNKYTIEAIKQFEKLHPDIKVNCSYAEWSGFETRNKVQMISAMEADVMQINFGWLDQYSPDGTGYYDINQLGDYIDLGNFSEDMLEYGYEGDALNAIPIAMNTETVYINKTIYDKYGLDVPTTWDDLFNAAKVMSKDGIYPISAASKSMWLYLIAYTEQYTGDKFLSDDGSLNFDEEDFQVMIDFYKKLVDEKVVPQLEHYERIKLDNEEYAGSVAWVSDAESYFGQAIENGREIVIADYTTIEGHSVGEGWYAKPATMYAVSTHTSQPEEAGMLLDFLLNSEEMAQLQGLEKGIPISESAKKVIADEGMLEGIQYDASQKMESVPMSQLHAVLEDSGLIDDFFAAANEVIFDKISSEEQAEIFTEKVRADYF